MILLAKMIDFFKNKSMSDFKNSKKFYEFYSSRLKSKNTETDNNIYTLNIDGKAETNKSSMANHFNNFFLKISSHSTAEKLKCRKEIGDHLTCMKQ